MRYCSKKLPRKPHKHFTVIIKKLNLFQSLRQADINNSVHNLDYTSKLGPILPILGSLAPVGNGVFLRIIRQ